MSFSFLRVFNPMPEPTCCSFAPTFAAHLFLYRSHYAACPFSGAQITLYDIRLARPILDFAVFAGNARIELAFAVLETAVLPLNELPI